MRLPFGKFSIWLAALSLCSCARHPLIEQEIENSYSEAAALDTLHDYEVARLASAAQLSRVEGLLARERNDAELLALAARGWCRYAFFFAWDEREAAEAGGDAGAAHYHAERALAGFERASFYAAELLELSAEGFPKDRPEKLAAYLQANFVNPEEAPLLMWAGCAELGRGLAETDPTRRDAARKAAVLLLEHTLGLDPTSGDGDAELMLGMARALSGAARAKVEDHLQRARKLSHEKALLVDVAQAMFVDCKARDEKAFVQHLQRVLDAGDVSPAHRLDNVVAKRRARLYLESPAFRSRCAAP